MIPVSLLPYGEMTNDAATEVTLAQANEWTEVTAGWITGDLQRVTFGGDHYLVVPRAGKYLVNMASSLSASINQNIGAAVAVNGTAVTAGHGHATTAGVGDDIGASQNAILTLAANDQLSLAVVNHTSTATITIVHASMTVIFIGP